MATKEEIIKKAESRETLINKLDKKLDSLVETYQAKLLNVVNGVVDDLKTDEDDKLLNNSANSQVISRLDKELYNADTAAKTAIINEMLGGFANLVNFNGSYFQALDQSQDIKNVSQSVLKSLKQWLGIGKGNSLKKNGYLDTLVKSPTLKNEIKQRTVGAVISGQGWQQSKKELGAFIQGNKDKLGAMQRYYRNFTYDTYAQVDRKASEDFGNKLGYQFAIYAGGLIETSRKFCREHNGNVYHISEILKFEPKEAIPPNYNPIADLGGYGCRHSLNWIPDSLAIRMRPDAAKFITDPPKIDTTPKPQAAPPADQRKQEEEKPAPPAPTTTLYADTQKRYQGYSHSQAKRKISQLIPEANSIALGAKVPKENIPKILSAIDYLSNKYFVGANTVDKIVFSSTKQAYGSVSRSLATGNISQINFGSKTDSSTNRLRRVDLAKNMSRGKSAVDPENAAIATVVHEWAHVIATQSSTRIVNQVTGKNADIFFSVLGRIRQDYADEINGYIRARKLDKAGDIYLGKYAGTNLNEFMAEGFTEYTLSSTPSKYAVKIGELIDQFFKK